MTFSEYAMSSSLYPSVLMTRVCRPLDRLQIDAFLGHLPQWRKLPEPIHALNHIVRHVVDLFFGIEASDPESNRGVRQLFADAERPKHVGRLEARRGAG